ncbi:MAG: O-phosphoserine--tRNA ligase [Candidatus Lokiarchaeota archaeon]|nr:O-phosphoserine--tRNA ligase [Candidatus Lokiarchaeota archaeon]
MPFDTEKIKRDAKANYEKAWMETKKLLTLEGHLFDLKKQARSHPTQDFIFEARKHMLDLGFEELVLPMFVEEEDVYKQYGPEAALILDRLFYLAGLPRPDIGISNEKISSLKKIVKDFDKVDELKKIFRDYKKGDIEADDLIEVFIEQLGVEETQASEIIDKIFPELKNLKPIPTRTTLRSHTTALWFIVLGELIKKKKLPLQYFTICKKFRREQKIDATHLYDSNTLSLVVLTEKISLEDCRKIASDICLKLGFKNSRTDIKKATSKYYAPQTEFEIFVEHPKTKEWIEIGDGGFYSPVSLSQYDIQHPVFNIGFGVERICMIKTGTEDIRKLVYPYFYEEITFSDEEVSKSLKYRHIPLTDKGMEIRDAIIDGAIKNKDAKSPIKIKVWEGLIKDKKIEVHIWESDDNVSLLGPASLNKVWIKDGTVLGLSPDKTLEGGMDSGKTYLEGIANEMAYNIEIALDQGKDSYEHRVKMCYRGSEVNLELEDIVMEFIHSKQKKFDIRGPVFLGLSFNLVG